MLYHQHYPLRHLEVYQEVFDTLKEFKDGLYTVLLHGISGSGKTFTSCLLAQGLGCKFTKYISANELIMFSDSEKVYKLSNLIQDALSSKESLIIIDDLDIILEWNPRSFSNKVLQMIKTMLGTIVTDSKLIIILNCTHYEELDELYIFDRVKLIKKLDATDSPIIQE